MSTVKGTKKNNDWEKAPGNVIVCQKCGKTLQKSIRTDSVIYCPRCGHANYSYLEDNISVQFPAVLLEADNSRKYIRTAIMALRELKRAPVKEYDAEDSE